MTPEAKWIVGVIMLGVVMLSVGKVLFGVHSPTSWRRSPFKIGKHYRVIQTFQAMRDTFTAGEVLVYRSEAYSRYDGITGYFFQAPNDTLTRAWDVRDDEDLAVWATLFERVSGSAARSEG